MRPALACALMVVTLASCNAVYLDRVGTTCDSDAMCAPGQLCLLAQCTATAGNNLGNVDLQVSPLPETGFKGQSFLAVDASRSVRQTLRLRPTLRITLPTCFDCTPTPPNPRRFVEGTLALTAPASIKGQPLVENATVDSSGTARVGLLENVAYQPVIFPTDVDLPILRGEPLFASSTSEPEVMVPDPTLTWRLQGRVVENAYEVPPMPVPGARVWLLQGETRLVRDVITDADGRFSLNVLRGTSSGLTLWVAPGVARQPVPWVSFPSVNLDADKDLGDVDLGLSGPRVTVSGRVTGPNGNGLVGALVKLEGPAGAGTLKFTAATDAEGNYGGTIPAGVYQRAVIPPAGSNAAILQEADVDVGSLTDGGMGLVHTMDIQTVNPLQACGAVTDASGNPVPNAAVAAVRIANTNGTPGPASDATAEGQATTGSDGQFCLTLPPGQYLLTGAPPSGSNLPSRTDLVNVPRSRAYDVLLPRPAFILGTVTTCPAQGCAPGEAGTPVRLAKLKAFSPVLSSSRGALPLGEAITQDDGTFMLVVPDLAATVSP